MNLRSAARLLTTVLPIVLVSWWSAASLSAAPQEPQTDPSATERAGESFEVAPAATETVAEIMERERRLPHSVLLVRLKEELPSGYPKQHPEGAPAVSSWPPHAEDRIPDLLRPLDPRLPQTVGLNFQAIQCCTEAPFIPPDSMGDVGPTQIVAISNGRIKVFDKVTGVLGPLNASTNTFFASVQAGGTSDPHVRYDRLSGRWFVVMVDLSGCPNKVVLAVSSGPTITGAASFTFFSFVGETTPGNHFTDYPTLGVDANALYIGANMFDQSNIGCTAPFDPVNVTVWVIRKSSVTGPGPAVVTAFRGLVNRTTGVGTWTPQGADNDDPAATQGYFVGVDFFSFDILNFFRVSNPGGTPTLSAQMNVTVPTTEFPILQVQPPPVTPPAPNGMLDSLDDRPFAATVHRNKITGAVSLWTAHNIEVNTAGVGTFGGGRNGSRWYEFGNLTTTPPTMLQAGTVFDSAASTANPFGHWIPSIAMSGQGHAAIAMSRASAVNPAGFAGVVAAGRLRGAAAGTMQGTSVVVTGAATYDQGGAPERWGDYSQTVVDPNDDQTMWTFQERANSASTWGLYVARLIAPPPATPATATPANVGEGQASVNVTITGTSTAGSEFFDPGPDTGGPGFANRLTASITGGVTVNSATFVNTTQVALNISTVGAPPGTKTVRITNPDGQNREAAILVVDACPNIIVNPATVPSGTVGSPYSVTFSQTNGNGPITFSLSGTLPTGLTFNPVTATLSGTPTQLGSFNFTVTATQANGCSGSRDYTLVINCQTITVSPSSIPAGTVGSPYSQTFTQSGGFGTITWSSTGTLPAGITLNPSTGVLSGTPSQVGSFPITITATDSRGCTGSVSVTLVINCQTITVSPSSIPAGTAGSPYSVTFTQTGAIGTVTWSSTGTLPAGITLNPATGELSGTPTQVGSFPITVTATDSNGCTGFVNVTLVINCQTITVSPSSIPAGTAGSPYSQTFTQTGAIGTVTWSSTGTLPTGITLNPTTGVLSGTTTQTGSFPITVTATDSNGCAGSVGVTLVIGCQTITVSPSSVPPGSAGTPYSVTFTQTGAIGTVTWSSTGTLPTGITLNPTTGELSGTTTQTGSFPITVTATDSNGCTGSVNVTLVIGCPTITVNPTTIPAATAGSPYSQTFTQTGGAGTITWSVTGTLPAGITLNPSTGVLSGTPTQVGSFPITITATDANGCTGSRDYTLVVNAAGPFVPRALLVDEAGNRVFEAGETAIVAPSWRNDTGAPQLLTGGASLFTGPGTSIYTIPDAAADYGSVAAGATANCSSTTGNCYSFNVTVPVTRPSLHWDSTYRETMSSGDVKDWTLHLGDSFTDVPRSNGFYRFVETLLHKHITGGCSGNTYCPGASTLREQMAVFVLVAKEGPGYQPPACTAPMFNDVPATNIYCRFIEELSRRGVVSGCGNGNYCPQAAVTREQMAVFVLRTLEPTVTPPACTTPMFNDVPASSPFCRYIEELARRGVVSGCGGGAYCPAQPVRRDETGVFISVTFGLTLYGL